MQLTRNVPGLRCRECRGTFPGVSSITSRMKPVPTQHTTSTLASNSVSSGTVVTSSGPTNVSSTISGMDSASTSPGGTSLGFSFACPICLQTTFKLEHMPQRRYKMCCSRCSRSFDSDSRYVDLTLTSGVKQKFENKSWSGTEIFRSPLVSFVYERGWRQGFAWAGFPGVDKEYDMAMEYLRTARGAVLVDMSCGSGLFTRKFAASGQFSGVIAADYSESMLTQTQAYLREGGAARSSDTPVVLLRADVGRLPFATGSVAAMHAGAAIHCWPDPQAAMAEISRVLAPGGVFVASTFLLAAAPLGEVFGDDLVRPLNNLVGPNLRTAYRFWEELELRELCANVGLQEFRRNRTWRFIMFSVTKPLNSPSGTDTDMD